MGDWFAQNAPKTGGDWFSQNAPDAAPQTPAPNAGLAPPPGASVKMQETAPSLVGPATSVLDLPSNAYHHPLDTLIGAAKGVIPAIQAGLPQGAQINEDNSNNRFVPEGVRKTLAQTPPAAPAQPGFIDQILSPSNPAQESGATVPSLIGMATGAVQLGKGLLGKPNTLPPGTRATNNFTGENPSRAWAGQETPNARYSPEGSHLAAPLRSNSLVDLPAEAHTALPDYKRAAADLGVDPARDFTGRNGLLAAKRIASHAIDLTEAEAKLVIDPVRSTEVPPEVLAKNPELASQFTEAQIKKGLTINDIDSARIDLNKKLRMGNFYSKPPSAQYAVQDPLATAHAAADQARDVVYGAAEQATGADLRGLKGRESSAIKLADSVDSTAKTLSQQTAKYESASPGQKAMGEIRHAINIRQNPTNAFEPTFANPTDEFNRNMQAAFKGVKPAPGSIMKNGRLLSPGPAVLTPPPGKTPPAPNTQGELSLTPSPKEVVAEKPFSLTPPAPGVVGPTPIQQALRLTGGENIPGEELKLTSPGDMPPEAQRPLSFMESPNNTKSGPVAPGGVEMLKKAARAKK